MGNPLCSRGQFGRGLPPDGNPYRLVPGPPRVTVLRKLWPAPLAVFVVLLFPMAGATLPPPVHGTVITCGTTTVVCKYAFNGSLGSGWANATDTYSLGEKIAIQLPGEAAASYNLSYATYVAKLTGTYTYWTVGQFYGTDVNTGKVVYGTTNTNVTITAHCTRGCTYTYTTDNGTIVVKFTRAEITSTTIACSPSTITVTQKTTCTVTVTDGWNSSHLPTGKVKISDGRLGSLSDKGVCLLTNGTCSFTFHPFDNSCGTVPISASFVGNTAYYPSAGSTHVSISTAC